MKFAVFVLIAGFCLVSANSVPKASEPIEEQKVILDTTKFVLRTLKGIHCSILGVQNIRDAAQGYIDALDQCGQNASDQAHAVVDSCVSLISACDDVIHYKTALCTRTVFGQQKPVSRTVCATNVLRGLKKINKSVHNTVNLIRNVPEIYTDATSCIGTACRNLETSFTSYPSFVKQCSKLKSP